MVVGVMMVVFLDLFWIVVGFELVIIVIWGGFGCCDCSLVLLALFALVSGGLRLWFWFAVWVACLLADTLLFVACNVCFGEFGALIVGWLLVCDTFGFCLIVLFLYNVISFGILVISFVCFLLV